MNLSRPWATRRERIGEKGLRAVLGLNLPSKGPCIKDKSGWLGLHSHLHSSWCKQGIESTASIHFCVSSLASLSICFPLLLRIRSFPLHHAYVLLFSLSSHPPYDRVVAWVRIRGRCLWHHRSGISDQLSQGSGEEVSSPSGCCKIPTTRESPSRRAWQLWRRCRGGKQLA